MKKKLREAIKGKTVLIADAWTIYIYTHELFFSFYNDNV